MEIEEQSIAPKLARIRMQYIGTREQIAFYETLEEYNYLMAQLRFEKEWNSNNMKKSEKSEDIKPESVYESLQRQKAELQISKLFLETELLRSRIIKFRRNEMPMATIKEVRKSTIDYSLHWLLVGASTVLAVLIVATRP